MGLDTYFFKTTKEERNEKIFEILDGMPKIIPAGVSLNDMMFMSNLNKSYNTILNYDNKIPVFFLARFC